jgi:hypothetical protein
MACGQLAHASATYLIPGPVVQGAQVLQGIVSVCGCLHFGCARSLRQCVTICRATLGALCDIGGQWHWWLAAWAVALVAGCPPDGVCEVVSRVLVVAAVWALERWKCRQPSDHAPPRQGPALQQVLLTLSASFWSALNEVQGMVGASQRLGRRKSEQPA